MPSGSRDQVVGGGTPTDVPATIGTLPMYSIGGQQAHITNSVFKQADSGHQVIVGVSASVNAGQVATKPVVVIGESSNAWGDGAICIGKSSQAGVNAARDGCVVIGTGISADGKNAIRVGSALALGAGFDDWIAIGTQASATRSGGISIGVTANSQGPDAVAIGTSTNSAEGSSIAIGRGSACPNSGLGTPNKNIAIGDGASVSTLFGGGPGIAIGTGSSNNGQNTIAIGNGASIVGTGVFNSIAIGAGATSSRSLECVIGNNTSGSITLLSIQAGAGVMAGIRGGATAGVGIRNVGDTLTLFQVDESATANDVRMLVYDVTAAALRRVTIGAADSGGVGFRALRIPN